MNTTFVPAPYALQSIILADTYSSASSLGEMGTYVGSSHTGHVNASPHPIPPGVTKLVIILNLANYGGSAKDIYLIPQFSYSDDPSILSDWIPAREANYSHPSYERLIYQNYFENMGNQSWASFEMDISRQRWFRVAVAADSPAGTTLNIYYTFA